LETIKVGYYRLPNTLYLASHKFILYERHDGVTFQIHGRGSDESGLSPVDNLMSSGPNSPGGFGYLDATAFKTTELTKVKEGTRLETIFQGEDLSAKFFTMVGMAQGISEEKTEYNAESNNSNTLVDRIVQWSGGRAPGLDDEIWSPGSVPDEQFRPAYYKKLPPVLWGKDTYQRHSDVVRDLFGEIDIASSAKRQVISNNGAQGASPGTKSGATGNGLALEPGANLEELRKKGEWSGESDLNGPEGKVFDVPIRRKRTLHAPSTPRTRYARSGGRTGMDKGAERGRNPFSLKNPDLRRQAEIVEGDPQLARMLIKEAKRRPELFNL
jgi:hypothetical protein